jgi:Protein of unknown function (DUF3592).
MPEVYGISGMAAMIYNKRTGTYRRGFLNSYKFKDVWMSVGIIFLITGILLMISTVYIAFQPNEQDETTTATIIDFEKSEKTQVEYYVDGERYTAWFGFYNSTNKAGDEITISYNSADPRDSGTGNRLFLIMFGGMGGLIGILGLMIVIVRFNRLKKNKVLKERGEYVLATVILVKPDTSQNNNGSHPWMVLCDYNDGGRYYEFESERSNFKPDVLEGESIKVFVEYNETYEIINYYVDL